MLMLLHQESGSCCCTRSKTISGKLWLTLTLPHWLFRACCHAQFVKLSQPYHFPHLLSIASQAFLVYLSSGLAPPLQVSKRRRRYYDGMNPMPIALRRTFCDSLPRHRWACSRPYACKNPTASKNHCMQCQLRKPPTACCAFRLSVGEWLEYLLFQYPSPG